MLQSFGPHLQANSSDAWRAIIGGSYNTVKIFFLPRLHCIYSQGGRPVRSKVWSLGPSIFSMRVKCCAINLMFTGDHIFLLAGAGRFHAGWSSGWPLVQRLIKIYILLLHDRAVLRKGPLQDEGISDIMQVMVAVLQRAFSEMEGSTPCLEVLKQISHHFDETKWICWGI